MSYMTKGFESLGLKVEHFPYTLPEDWRPTEWAVSYKASGGTTINLTTAFPVSGTKATGPAGLTADAVWVGIGSGADFIGRDVKGKAVVIYSTFVPGGRSHSASDRAGLFNSNTRAVQMGAALVINVPHVGKLPLVIVVPVTEWKSAYEQYVWFTYLAPTPENGLKKPSGADAFQVKSLSVLRLVRLGCENEAKLQAVAAAVSLCVGYQLPQTSTV